MATMVPEVPVDGASTAEHNVYQWLRDGLGDKYRVFHSLPFVYSTEGGLREGEIDFLVTHPTKGLLVIEVKGGAVIRYDGRSWTSTEHGGGPTHDIRDPFDQARENLHKILGKVTDEGIVQSETDLPFPFGYACWFPGTDQIAGDGLPTHVNKQCVLTRPDQSDPERAVNQTLGSWAGARDFDTDQSYDIMEKVTRRVLQPEFRVVPSLRTQIQAAESEFSRLTEEQADLFDDMLRANQRALVKGFAGTGKTFLATHRAAELGRAGEETLLLCFNRHLADHLEQKMEGVPNTKVATFHQLADEWDRYVPDRSFPENPDQEFWKTGAADLLTEAVEHGGIQYDAILVDEAQDFRETWWLPIELMLRDDGKFYVFLDPGQNIFGTESEIPADVSATFPLRKNCRSSKHISRFADQLLEREEGTISPEHVGEGVEVRQHSFSERSDQVAILEELLRTLKQDEGLSSSDIVLLSPRSYRNSVLAEADHRLAGYDIEPFQLEEPSESTIYYESIQGFKGMEAPVVILFDIQKDHIASSDTNVYVGATRARHVLHVVHERGWQPGSDNGE